ncbi:MAG TPA: NAD(P)/FAD-dependent oxidoreductase [Rubricoccaceae bacterium]|nr:NAD(P)/FAD-dependent oxidoreductase [Rubricoccaceae bacterium]
MSGRGAQAKTVQRGGAVVIGAGPAGLTAAYELRTRTDLPVTVFEATGALGGISQTVVYRGNRMDIGGHRFFSKSDRVLDWWLAMIPPEAGGAQALAYQGKTTRVALDGGAPIPPEAPAFMLRERSSRIFFAGQFFDYPIRLTPATLRKLGLRRAARIGASYLRSTLSPFREPQNLEEFFINRFGRELYETFFRDYTEKVWGAPCSEIPADWGAQRVKGLSIGSALRHFVRGLVGRDGGARQKGTETSLIEQFLYPRRGPGEMWEVVAARVAGAGGAIRMRHRVDRLRMEDGRVAAVEAVEEETGRRVRVEAPDFVVSTMPLRTLVRALVPFEAVPSRVRAVAEGLVYRDFLIVGLLLKRLAGKAPGEGLLRDNWIYIQEPGVKAGRLQVFNNWSPYLVADPATVWVGVEFFCNEGDPLWGEADEPLIGRAVEELTLIGLAAPEDVLDGTVVRMPKAYPAYTGTYDRFEVLRHWLDGVENLAPVGRNGMHRYNNQDHSMLTAMTVVDQLVEGRRDPAEVWAVNTEQEYHEEK